jgi:hypothetical protein
MAAFTFLGLPQLPLLHTSIGSSVTSFSAPILHHLCCCHLIFNTSSLSRLLSPPLFPHSIPVTCAFAYFYAKHPILYLFVVDQAQYSYQPASPSESLLVQVRMPYVTCIVCLFIKFSSFENCDIPSGGVLAVYCQPAPRPQPFLVLHFPNPPLPS